ncbi:MAG: hypothetical protein ACI9MR_003178 [Myxococcota bacterium]|jgi:hypothetical protein
MGGDPRFKLFTTLPKGDKSFYLAMLVAVGIGMIVGYLIADLAPETKEESSSETTQSFYQNVDRDTSQRSGDIKLA